MSIRSRSHSPPPSRPAEELSHHLIECYDNLLLSLPPSKTHHKHPPGSPHHHDLLVDRSLRFLKNLLIGASLGGVYQNHGLQFIQLQSQVELNASIILLHWLSIASSQLLNFDSSHRATGAKSDGRTQHLLKQVGSACVILQGLLHLYPPTQRVFASRYNYKILLDFLPLALQTTLFYPLALPLLDLLLTSFIHSATNSQVFESMGGLEILIQAMKHKEIKKDVRVKVLETIWGWWIDEESGGTGGHTGDSSSRPTSPDVPSPTLINFFPRPSDSTFFHTPVVEGSYSHVPGQQPHSARLLPQGSHGTMLQKEEPKPPQVDLELQSHRPSSAFSPQSGLSRLGTKCEQEVVAQPESSVPMSKVLSNGSSASGSVSRKPASSDPATRLRQMLESTAGEFIPATPHHQRVAISSPHGYNSPSKAGQLLNKSHPIHVGEGLGSSRGTGYRSDEKLEDGDSDFERFDATPVKLFSTRACRLAAKENTPQRMLRHKQSASLGSIHDRHFPRSLLVSSEHQSSSGSSSPESQSGSEPETRKRNRTDWRLRSSTPPLLACQSKHKGPSPSGSATPVNRGQSRRRMIEQEAEDMKTPTTSITSGPAFDGSELLGPANAPKSIATTPVKVATPMRSAVGKSLGVISNQPSTPRQPPSSARKTFLTRPGTPNVKIDQEDLEMMINEKTINEKTIAVASSKLNSDTENATTEKGEQSKHRNHDSSRKKRDMFNKHQKYVLVDAQERSKNEILGKYMANSEQLVKSFKQLGLGLSLTPQR